MLCGKRKQQEPESTVPVERICNKLIIIKQIVETRIYPNGEKHTRAYFLKDGVQEVNKSAQRARMQKKNKVMDIPKKEDLKRREL
jgi:hypothetical protein